MKIGIRFIAGILFLSSMVVVPGMFAGQEFVLVGGTRAVVEGRQMILIDTNSKRSVAPPGRYDIRGGRQSIYVQKDGIVIRERPNELR